MIYECEISAELADLDTVARAIMYGSLTYSKTETYFPAVNAVFSCIDGSAAVHIIRVQPDEKEYSMRDGRYTSQKSDGASPELLVPYILINEETFHIIQDIAVSYQPSGMIEKKETR